MKEDSYFLNCKKTIPHHDNRINLDEKSLELLAFNFDKSSYQPFGKIMNIVVKSVYGRKIQNKELVLFCIREFRQYYIWRESLDNKQEDDWVDNEVRTEYISALTHLALWDRYQNLDQEIEWMYEALSIYPESPQVQYNLGHLYRRANALNRAITHYKMSLKYDKNWIDSYLEMGIIYKDQKRNKLAVKIFEDGLKIKKCPRIMNELGVLYSLINEKEKARKLFDNAMKILETDKTQQNKVLEATLWINYGYIHSNMGEIRESLECYEKAMELDPNNLLSFQNYLLNSNYLFNSPLESFNKHVEFGRIITKMCKKVEFTAELAKYNPGEKIRIGYVSGDFWGHAVSFFTEVLFTHCNFDKFDVFCYSNGELNMVSINNYDNRIHWKSIKHLDTYNAVKTISADKPHILIDLAGHTSNNRLDVFAYRIAPVQMTYIGYPNTTGMKEIDYRIVDSYTDVKTYATEKLVKLNNFLCYHNPLKKTPRVKDHTPNKIVFGTFNKFNKISDKTCEWWDDMLTYVSKKFPSLDIKLLIKGSFYTDYNHVILSKFSEKNRKKILIVKKTKTYEEHLDMYRLMDISLDTLPYTGTTTTCESLWSGVPVITSFDDCKHVSSVSASILKHCGMEEWIVKDKKEFIELCAKWCENLQELNNIKQSLHTKFMKSAMTNKEQFIKDYEAKISELI
jgi:protein O-GlcNAc transferase